MTEHRINPTLSVVEKLKEIERQAEPSELQDLPELNKKAWSDSMLMYQRKLADIDALNKTIEKLEFANRCQKMELEQQQEKITLMQSETASSRMERDQCVRDLAKYEAMFESVIAQLNAFEAARSQIKSRKV